MTDSHTILVFTDLDDSLFSTLRKIPESQHDGKILAARAADSAAKNKNSYMTRKQATMMDWMDLSRCIPVTARSTEAYSRVTLPFSGPAAIVANGAVMLDSSGVVNEDWANIVKRLLLDKQEAIHGLSATLEQLAEKRAMNIRTWPVIEPSCGAVYAVAKSNESSQGEGLQALLDDLKAHLRADDCQADSLWQFHTNGNNLSVTPSGISKANAVQYLLNTLAPDEDILTVGVGDSASDLDFMRLCDIWITPAQSQIDRLV